MEENRLFPSIYLHKGHRTMRRNDTVEYDERAYMTETHGCKVTVRFRKKCDKELAKNTIAPLMNCFEEKQAARIA